MVRVTHLYFLIIVFMSLMIYSLARETKAVDSFKASQCASSLERNDDGTVSLMSSGDEKQTFASLQEYANWWTTQSRKSGNSCPVLYLSGEKVSQNLSPEKESIKKTDNIEPNDPAPKFNGYDQIFEKSPINELDDYEHDLVFREEANYKPFSRDARYKREMYDWGKLSNSSERYQRGQDGQLHRQEAAKEIVNSMNTHSGSSRIAQWVDDQKVVRHPDSENTNNGIIDVNGLPIPPDRDLTVKEVNKYMNERNPDAPYTYSMEKTGPNQFAVKTIHPKRDSTTYADEAKTVDARKYYNEVYTTFEPHKNTFAEGGVEKPFAPSVPRVNWY